MSEAPEWLMQGLAHAPVVSVDQVAGRAQAGSFAQPVADEPAVWKAVDWSDWSCIAQGCTQHAQYPNGIAFAVHAGVLQQHIGFAPSFVSARWQGRMRTA